MENEIWKDIKGYEGLYQVSNLGNVKGLDRVLLMKGRYPFVKKGKALKPCKDKRGYYTVKLSNGIGKVFNIHQLVAIAFLGHTPCGYKLVVNHKDTNPLNNKSDNLELVTQRENANRKHCKSSSRYTGVSWSKDKNKWESGIVIDGKKKFLGRFEIEEEASEAYQKALSKIINNQNFKL